MNIILNPKELREIANKINENIHLSKEYKKIYQEIVNSINIKAKSGMYTIAYMCPYTTPQSLIQAIKKDLSSQGFDVTGTPDVYFSDSTIQISW